MELKITKRNFLNLLKWPQGVLDKKGTMPILSNILLNAAQRLFTLLATDLETAFEVTGEADVKKGGKAVVGGRSLFEIVKEAPQDEIILTSLPDFGVEIASGSSKFRVVGMNPDDFPNLPQVSKANILSIQAAELEEMIEKTLYASSTDETRYTLNGLYLTTATKEAKSMIRLVGTDGHRLSTIERETGSGWNSLEKGIIMPRRGLLELRKILSEGEGDLDVSIDEKMIVFRRGTVTLSVRLVEGEFPPYEQVIPKKAERIVSVNRETLMGALRRSALLVTDVGRGVKFSFRQGSLEMTASNPDRGEAQEEISVDYKGTPFHVGFNPRYFLDLLDVVEDEKVVLELKDEISPCLVRSEFDRGFLSLIMPMRI